MLHILIMYRLWGGVSYTMPGLFYIAPHAHFLHFFFLKPHPSTIIIIEPKNNNNIYILQTLISIASTSPKFCKPSHFSFFCFWCKGKFDHFSIPTEVHGKQLAHETRQTIHLHSWMFGIYVVITQLVDCNFNGHHHPNAKHLS